GRAESGRAQPNLQLISREPKVAKSQVMVRKAAVEQSFQPTIVLHTVRESAADDADVVLGLNRQAFRRGLAAGQAGPGGQYQDDHAKARADGNRRAAGFTPAV